MSSPGMNPAERLLATLVLSAVLGIVGVLTWQRLQIESAPAKVEIAFPEKRLLEAAAQDPQAPQALLAAGVTTLVRIPYTLEHMIQYGLAEAWHPKPDQMEIRFADIPLTGNATIYLTGQYGMPAVQIRLRENQYILDVHFPQPLARIDPSRYILEIPSGPMPPGFRRGLFLPAGDWGQTTDLDQFTQAIASLRPDIVIPDWRGGINARYFFLSYLRTPWLRKPVMAISEFGLPWAGKWILRQESQRHFYRCHLVSKRIASQLSAEGLRLRLVRAARERHVELLYLDPPRSWRFAFCLKFFQDLKKSLAEAGISLGPGNLPMKRTGHLAMSMIYLGVATLVFSFIWKAALWAVGCSGEETVDRMLIIRLKPSQFRWSALFLLLSLLILQGEGQAGWSAKIAAWLIAVLAPLLSFSRVAAKGEAISLEKGWWLGFEDFCFISLTSLAAGLSIAVLLYHPEFVLRFDGFWGVKLAYLLPLFLIPIYFFPRITDAAWWRQRWQKPFRQSTLLGALAISLLAALLILRSGNFVWMPKIPGELDVRDILEKIFGVRPRFKEFLIGHPLLLIGLVGRRWVNQANRLWPDVCLVAGSLGQVSLINTFCHIHTPLAISLLRSFHGLWLGLLLGSFSLWILQQRLPATGKA